MLLQVLDNGLICFLNFLCTCQLNCKIGLRCGDGIVTAGKEACDDGVNQGGYGSGTCSPGCVIAPKCGDGVVNAAFGETCDAGGANGTYGGCGTDCRQGPLCGDGIKNGSELCDDGVNDGSYGKCGGDCKFGPRCGDKVVQAPETCDLGSANGGIECSSSCTMFITK